MGLQPSHTSSLCSHSQCWSISQGILVSVSPPTTPTSALPSSLHRESPTPTPVCPSLHNLNPSFASVPCALEYLASFLEHNSPQLHLTHVVVRMWRESPYKLLSTVLGSADGSLCLLCARHCGRSWGQAWFLPDGAQSSGEASNQQRTSREGLSWTTEGSREWQEERSFLSRKKGEASQGD